MARQIAVITKKVITLLSLSCPINTPIYIGPSNEAHMKSSHPRDFANYYPHIGLIYLSRTMSALITRMRLLSTSANLKQIMTM